MKLPNGYGSVHKLKGKRRKPWRARITDGFVYDLVEDKQVQKYKTLGYYETKQKALQALAAYNENPYDLDADKITFAECYEKWTEEYFKKITPAAIRTVKAAYKYCSSLYNMRMKDIRVYHLSGCMDDGYIIQDKGKDKGKKRMASAGTKSRMKSMFNLMFDYAMAHEVVFTNYARNYKIDAEILDEKEKNKRLKIPFSNEEIDILWDNIEFGFTDMVLIQIYSGWRPQELAILQVADIDLEKGIMSGGLKSDAGRNRIVPIHPLIEPLIRKRYDEAMKLHSEYLFNDETSQTGMEMTYDKYRGRFNKVMERNKMTHTPHECRHTFITIGKSNKMDQYILKLIVGHEIDDVTEKFYTHRTIEQLRNEMNACITKHISMKNKDLFIDDMYD